MITNKRSTEPLNDSPEEASRVVELQRILMTEQHREISYDEAFEIAESLISFYQALAEPAWINPAEAFAAELAAIEETAEA